MKPSGYLPRYKCDEKLNVYSGAPVNRGFYERNLKKAKPIYLAGCPLSPRQYYRKKKDREFNKILNNYYDDFNKFKNKFKLKPKIPQPEQANLNYNLYEIKKKNLSSLFFIYDSRNNKGADYNMTDDLINSMNDGKISTLIKSTQNKNDYESRLNGFKKKPKKKKGKKHKIKYNNYIKEEDSKNNSEFKEEDVSGNQSSSVKNDSKLKRSENVKVNEEEEEEDNDDEINYLKDGDKDIDDNYLKLINNNIGSPLLKDTLSSNFNEEYKPPKYQIPQSVLEEEENNKKKSEEMQNLCGSQRNQTLNKYKDGELKRFQDMIKNNEYPCFEQITNPYYQTNYIPPPCFPKMPEDEEESENESYIADFGFDEDNKNVIEEDEEQLILLSNQINNKEFPMFEHLLRNDFKGNYAPPVYKIPPQIKKSIQKEEEKYQLEFETYEKNKAANVGNDVNQYNNGELKMLNNIIKDDKYPKFEQLIDPYYQTNYIPPDIFPKPDDLEEKEDPSYGYGDFELDTRVEVKGDDDENNLVLINKAILNEEYPMFENLISSDFKGNYAPPFYKVPEFMKEKEKNIAQQNRELFNSMKGTYMNPNEHRGEYPVLGQMIDKDFDKKEDNKEDEDDDYSKFE